MLGPELFKPSNYVYRDDCNPDSQQIDPCWVDDLALWDAEARPPQNLKSTCRMGGFCMSWKADFVLRVMEGGRGCGALAGELLQPARLHGRRLHGPSFEPGGGTASGRVFNLLIHSARACRLLQ